MSEQAIPADGKKTSDLMVRVRSGVMIGVITLTALYLGGAIFASFMAFVTAVGAMEWYQMTAAANKEDRKAIFYIWAISALTVTFASFAHNPIYLLAIPMILGAAIPFIGKDKVTNIVRCWFGSVYVIYALALFAWLRLFSDEGLYYVATLLFMIWASDSFAYFFGKYIGGPKLAPKISPKKTWAGMFGSCFGATLLAILMVQPNIYPYFSGTEPIASMWVMGLMAMIVGVFGQVGDLMISLFKRHYGIKDMGDLIPGHGGILDRVDALIFVTLFYASFIWICQ